MVTSREALEIVELVYYVPVFFATIFVLVKHGFRKQLGWIYLAILGLLRIVGSSAGLASAHNPNNENLLETYIICFTVGLSPLILCLLGMTTRVHEGMAHPPVPLNFTRIFHLAVIGALILAIIGGTDQFSSQTSEVSTGHTLTKAAIIVFLGVFLALAAIVVLTMLHVDRVVGSERRLVVAGLASLPFILVRLIYSTITAFDYKNSDFSLISTKREAVILQGILSVLMEFIVVAMFLVAGFLTPPVPKSQAPSGRGRRNMPVQDSRAQPGPPYRQQQGVMTSSV